jgi:threonine dehydrogenase-like Zn-dependent dehydrogenase
VSSHDKNESKRLRRRESNLHQIKDVPEPGYNEALVRVTLTTICGTDLHILKGEYPVKAGLTKLQFGAREVD